MRSATGLLFWRTLTERTGGGAPPARQNDLVHTCSDTRQPPGLHRNHAQCSLCMKRAPLFFCRGSREPCAMFSGYLVKCLICFHTCCSASSLPVLYSALRVV